MCRSELDSMNIVPYVITVGPIAGRLADALLVIRAAVYGTVVDTAAVLASQAEAIVDRRRTWPQATKRRTGD